MIARRTSLYYKILKKEGKKDSHGINVFSVITRTFERTVFIRVHARDNRHNSRTEEAGHRAGGSSGPPRVLKNITDRHALWITLPGDRRRSSAAQRDEQTCQLITVEEANNYRYFCFICDLKEYFYLIASHE